MFKDTTDYDSDERPWLVFDRRDGIVARGLSKRDAVKLASVREGGYRRSARVDTGQTEGELRAGA